MNKLKRLFITFSILSIFLPSLLGQATGELILNIFPKDAYIKLDDQLIHLDSINQPYKIVLEEGEHLIKIWNRGLKSHEASINIIAGRTKTFSKNISKNYTEPYQEYLKEVDLYKKKINSYWGITGGILIINAGYNFLNIQSRKSLKNQLETLDLNRQRYEGNVSPEDAKLSKLTYEASLKTYERKRKNHNLRSICAIPLLLGSGFFSYKIIKARKQYMFDNPMPVFEEKAKFSYWKIGLDDKSYSSSTAPSLNISFHF